MLSIRSLSMATCCLVILLGVGLPVAGTSATPERRPILITVDDLPVAAGRLHQDPADRERVTRGLLDVLAKHHIRAVGFVIAGNIRGDSDCRLLDLWLAAGHELGNHSYGHPNYAGMDSAAYIADLEKGRAALQDVLAPHGKNVRFFRFPMLREGETPEKLDAVRRYLASSSQRNLPVTIDNQDWSFEEPWLEALQIHDTTATRLLADDYLASIRVATRNQEALGDELFGRPVPQVLLLHANDVGARNWDALFTWLEGTGHRFATADEVLADPAFSESHAFVWNYGCGLWDRIGHQRMERTARDEIAARLAEQSAAWSRGDIDSFCSIYADDAHFVTPTGLTKGRQEIQDRYKKKYPTGAAMGTLTLAILDFRPVWGMERSPFGDAMPGRIHGASIAATWELSYPDQPASRGYTLLVFERIGKSWKITRDASM